MIDRLTSLLQDEGRRFNTEWLDLGDKTVVPVLNASFLRRTLTTRLSAAASEVGVSHGMIAEVRQGRIVGHITQIDMSAAGLMAVLSGWNAPTYLLALTDLSGALLVADPEYSLLGGRYEFVRACLDVGVDEARAQFSRSARQLAKAHPDLMSVANEYRPRWRSWGSPDEVQAASYTARQLHLMKLLGEGQIEVSEFISEWLAARRQILCRGERLHGRFNELMNSVFYAIDDFVLDPTLRDVGDMSEREFQNRVASVWQQMSSLG
ncbi:hypothetical protein [Nonomuraea sp. NPDC001831]|uniref:hypothetical protein n=1 Tax=Nonomuraea sp. NPDC001831 TaxID=3364340 RepID=UPI0036CFE841